MDSKTRLEVRHATQRLRRPPSKPLRIRASFESDGKLGENLVAAPAELTVEATGPDGEPASWLNDAWWTEVIQRWGDELITVHIAPTASALLHAVVLHQVEMVKRVVPGWRVVGHAYRNDVGSDEAIGQLALSPYDEVRFIDQPRPGSGSSRARWGLALDELFGQVRREQARVGTTKPILIRLPAAAPQRSPTPAPVASTPATSA